MTRSKILFKVALLLLSVLILTYLTGCSGYRGVETEILLTNLKYPSAIFQKGNDLYISETKGRNVENSAGDIIRINEYDIRTGEIKTVKDNPDNSDALVVVDNVLYASSYIRRYPGERGSISSIDLNTGIETPLAVIEIATADMCLDSENNIYVLGSSYNSEAKSLYCFLAPDFTSSVVLLNGLGRMRSITYHDDMFYLSSKDTIYSFEASDINFDTENSSSETGNSGIDSLEIVLQKSDSSIGIYSLAGYGKYLYYTLPWEDVIGRVNINTFEDETFYNELSGPAYITIDKNNDTMYVLTYGHYYTEKESGDTLTRLKNVHGSL